MKSPNQCIKLLQRRAKFLEVRVEEAKNIGRDLSMDKAEIIAIQWALPILKEFVRFQKDKRGEE